MTLPEQTAVTDAGALRPDGQRWAEANDAWLSAAIAHLRLRLAAMAAETRGPREAPRGTNRWTTLLGGGGGRPEAPRIEAPTDTDLAAARRRRDEAQRAVDPAPALDILGDRLDLTAFEREVLLLAAAIELDTRIAGLCAAAQGDPAAEHPTFGLALALFEEPAWDVMAPTRPLRYWRLLEINQPGDRALTASALRADERAVNFLKGLSYLDDRLSPLLVPLEAEADATLPPSQESAAAEAAHHLRTEGGSAARRVQLVGADPISREMVARRAAQTLGLTLHKLPAAALPRQAAELETLARLWHRESRMLPIALYLDTDEEAGTDPSAPPLPRFLARSGGAFLIGTREMRGDLGPVVRAVPAVRPTAAEQADLWAARLGAGRGETAARLAGQFDLSAPAIRRIARGAGGDAALWRACIETSTTGMDRLAERIRPVARWSDIVLPAPEAAQLRELAAQVARRAEVYDGWGFRDRMNRGLGISALFVGDSGTGKTMAAEVIANALDLRLYRIDLSAVVSKYIGETEKNLRQLFDAAEGGGAVLFFDEADALFGKRSEVRDSHDRYANIETSYLLQRVESFSGLAILSTNMRGALDAAFLRRLRFVITFPYPGPAQRRAIWERAWPEAVPRAGLDIDRLARLNLAGGNIATVALNAAFMAADAGGPVTMERVLTAARAEYEKLERPVNEADFRWRSPATAEGAQA